jgi:hypothetical protein
VEVGGAWQTWGGALGVRKGRGMRRGRGHSPPQCQTNDDGRDLLVLLGVGQGDVNSCVHHRTGHASLSRDHAHKPASQSVMSLPASMVGLAATPFSRPRPLP